LIKLYNGELTVWNRTDYDRG